MSSQSSLQNEIQRRVIDIPVARVFVPLLQPSRYKGTYGGRGSGKSHFFGGNVVDEAIARKGLRVVCVREVQKDLKHSAKQLITDKVEYFDPPGFKVMDDEIRLPGGGVCIFQGMQDHTATSIKSLEGFDIAWIEEAHTLSHRSLEMLRPTIRKAGSEIWASWNPDQAGDAIDEFFRQRPPPGAIVVKANYADNPWLPQELKDEIAIDRVSSENFGHIWLGEYRKALKGAYYDKLLADAESSGRISNLSADLGPVVRAVFDLGIADAQACWVCQWVGRELRWLDYFEGVGQPLGYYAELLRKRGWGEAHIVLPHDGAVRDKVTAQRYSDHWRAAGYPNVRVVENQGKGAAMQRIEAARKLGPNMWFDRGRTEMGRKTLARYHERWDEDRKVGLGPMHDDASHCGDAFGLACVAYVPPAVGVPRSGTGSTGGWMG